MTGSFADGRHGASVRRAFAVFAVTLMVAAPALMVLSSLPSVDGAGYTHTVVYHKGDGTTLEVEYYGVPVAEYNPQFWQENITGIVKSGNPANWNPVSDFSDDQTVFNGWSTSYESTEGEIDPGDRLDSIKKGEDGKIHLYAVWGKVTGFKEVSTFTGKNDSLDKVYFNTGTKYTNIVIAKADLSLQNFSDDKYIGSPGTVGFTIRSDGNLRWLDLAQKHGVYANLCCDLIIDNIGLWTNSPGEDDTKIGMYANGHQLIIGTGITSTDKGSAMIYGGMREGNLGKIDESGIIVEYAETDVRIFSGTYASVYGGCHNGTVYGSTNVTIMGQNSGTGESAKSTTKIENTLYGGSHTGSVGTTNVLVAGGVMNGSGNHYPGYPVGDSHSNIIGGSRSNGTVTTSNVTVTNNAIVFAVQGGGRETGAITTNTYVTVSGKANVIFMVCGSVTNGINSQKYQFPVGTSHVTIKDDASIGMEDGSTDYGAGSVFGGGWDTYKNALYSSTMHTNVCVEGGTIHGSVYGGGYRGSIGSESSDNVGSTTVTISGGTIEGSVYGGGRGGIDPMSQSWAQTGGSSGGGNTTGRAYIYGDTSVTVSGGTVKGSVYGGGEGVAKSEGDINGVDDVSKVTGSATVSVGSSAKVMGDVYGGGLGVSDSMDVAEVQGGTIVTVEGEVGADSDGGNVFGGGQYGNVVGDVTVNVNGSVHGSVYGGGNGDASNINLGKVVGNVSVTVTGTAVDVYGGGNLGSVYGGASIEMNAATVNNVYGGGSGQGATGAGAAEVTGDINITLRSTSVSGDLYGGGMGVSSDSGPDSVATVKGSISISLLNGSEVSGGLYGGGRYGAVINEYSPGELYINISSSTVHGSVYAGGLGETDRTATYLTNRVAVVTNGSVGGSVYGGSRYGDDNVETVTDGETSTKQKIGDGTYHSRIYIVSGNVASGTSGNVYGGGFRGYSAMDTHIYIGAPAAAMVPGASAGGIVSVKSVYGGSSVGVAESGMLNAKLLMGDSEIVIGSEGYQSFSLGGDVFGAGDFCDITGNSTITFEDFSQDGHILSIQKVDELNIVRSTVHLDGNMDGSQTTGSPMLSLNLIGQLNLVGDGSEAGRSQLIVEAAAANISGYSSTYTSTSVETRNYNVLKINSGMVFSILGDDGESDGFIEGHTVLASDDNDYFGALVMGLKEILKDDPSFWVLRDGKYEETRVSDQIYTMGEVRSWYLDGSYKVQQTVLFTNSSDATLSERTSFMLPKVHTGSTISFAGYYINPYSPGSLDIVSADDLSGSNPGSAVSLNFGAGSGAKTLFGKSSQTSEEEKVYAGLDLALQDDNVIPAAVNGGVGLDMTLSTNSGFSRTGYIGSITIYFVEMNGRLAVNTFDVEVKVYLRITHTTSDHIVNSMVMEGIDSQTWGGDVDVYLPFLDNNATGEYTITNVESSGTIKITTVPTNLNRDGWNRSEYRDSPLKISGSTNNNLHLGTGGVFSPVLRISYQTNEYLPQADNSFAFSEVKLTIKLVEEGSASSENTIYVTIKPEMVTSVDVVFMDKVLNLTQTSTWTDYRELFSITINFGSLVSDYFLIVDTSKWVYPVLEDDQIANVQQTQDFIDSIKLSLTRDDDGSVLVSTNKESLGPLATGGKRVMSVEALLDLIQEEKPNTAYKDGSNTLSFDYSANYPGWYDTSSGYSRFNFGSEITEDLTVYAGYSVSITVHKHPDSPGTVNTTYLFPGAPGTPVNLNDHSDVALGYKVVNWYLGVDNGDGTTSYNMLASKDVEEFRTFSNVDLYVMLEPLPYKVTVEVDGVQTDIALYVGDDPVPPTTEEGKTYYKVYVGTNYRIEVASIPEGSHISSVTANSGNWNTFDTDGNKVTFEAPAMDLDIKITIVQEYTVTVTMPSSGGNHDNDLYGFNGNGNLVKGGAIKEIVLNLGPNSGDKKIMAPSADTVISVYGPDGAVIRYQDGYEGFTIDASELSGDVGYELYVNEAWEVKYGTGYTAYIDSRVDHKGNNLSIDQQTNPAVAYTGDVIRLVADVGYQFGDDFTAVGAALETPGVNERQYSVNTQPTGEKSDVVFGNAGSSTITVTVKVEFTTRDTNPKNRPEGSIIVATANGADVPVSDGTWSSGEMTYTFTATKQTYTITGSFTGYADSAGVLHYVTVDGNITVSLKFVAVAQTVVFSDGDSDLHTYDQWFIDDETTLLGMYANAGEYFAWAHSGGVLYSSSKVDISMFGDDGRLVLVGLPKVQDVPVAVEVMTVMIHSDQLSGNGFSVHVGSFTIATVSSEAGLHAEMVGEYVTLKSGSPGTGAFVVTLEGSGKVLYLHVTVIESATDVGRQGPFTTF